MATLLELDDVSVHYGHIQALREVSLHVEDGEVVTLIGANGAGKTTTLGAISGLLATSAGSVRLDGNDLAGVSAHERVRLGMCQAPEGRRIFPGMSVLENLEMGAYARRAKRADLKPDFDRVFDLFPRLAERRDQPGGTLSGGEQQMLAIGRALMAQPRLLLLDEPSLGLAPVIVDGVFDVIGEINRAGVSVLLVEQNVERALEIASRGYVLSEGRIALAGTSAELMANDDLRRSVLGIS